MLKSTIRLMLLLSLSCCQQAKEELNLSDGLVISEATIITTEGDQYDPFTGYVVAEQGKIVYVGEEQPLVTGNYTEIEGAGKYLIPGLIDSHVHANEVQGMTFPHLEEHPDLAREYRIQVPRSYLYFGYTTLINLGGISREQLDFWSSQPLKPNLYHTGRSGASVANGYPMNFAPEEYRYDNTPNFIYLESEADNIPDRFDPADHTTAVVVQRIKEEGGIAVKSYYETGFRPGENLPVPTVEIMNELQQHTHDQGLVLTVHGNSLKAHKFLAEVGVDIMAHGLWNWDQYKNLPGDSLPSEIKQVLDMQIRKQIGYTPTLTVIEGEKELVNPEFLDRPQLRKVVPKAMIDWYKTDQGQWFVHELFSEIPTEEVNTIYSAAQAHQKLALKYLSDHGGLILFGTDTPSGPIYTNQPGYNGYWEMELMQESGVPLDKILASSTLLNARAFHLDALIGSIKTGKRADMLLLSQNPLEQLEAYDQVETVILAGTIIDRESLAANQ